jgi:hypothetical protein
MTGRTEECLAWPGVLADSFAMPPRSEPVFRCVARDDFMRFPSVIALLALASANAALADPTPATGTDSKVAVPPAPDPDKPICKTMHETGSLTRSQRICMTHQQWEEQREEQRNMLNKPKIGPPLGS